MRFIIFKQKYKKILYNVDMRKIIGERLKELRTEKILTIKQLSEITLLSQSSISRWENDMADIKAENLICIAKFFNVTTDYLLGLDD